MGFVVQSTSPEEVPIVIRRSLPTLAAVAVAVTTGGRAWRGGEQEDESEREREPGHAGDLHRCNAADRGAPRLRLAL